MTQAILQEVATDLGSIKMVNCKKGKIILFRSIEESKDIQRKYFLTIDRLDELFCTFKDKYKFTYAEFHDKQYLSKVSEEEKELLKNLWKYQELYFLSLHSCKNSKFRLRSRE